MVDLELALAASARSWADRLHGFLADHGGARVRAVVMGAEEVLSEEYDLLLIDDVCSFLTPWLVERVRRHGRLVVGVFDPRDGTDAKRRLLDCNVDGVIESDASPDEFLAVIEDIRALSPSLPRRPDQTQEHLPGGRVITVGAPPGGCGATEVAIALGRYLGGVVVDADDIAPSLAQRLGAGMHPNLRTAIDVVHNGSGDPCEAVVETGGLRMMPGLATGDDWAQLHPAEVEAVVDELAQQIEPVVVNVGAGLERPQTGNGRFGLARAMVTRANVVVAVGSPTPVGVARLIRWLGEATVIGPRARLHAVVNQSRKSRFQRSEVEMELDRACPGVPVTFLPYDPRVTEAAWAGKMVGPGPFLRAMRGMMRQAVL